MRDVGVGRLPPLFILRGVPHVMFTEARRDGRKIECWNCARLERCAPATFSPLNHGGRTADPAFVKLRLETRNVDRRYWE